MHPWSRHIPQGVRDRGSAQIGHILGEHLHIRSAQSQQFDLPGTSGGITIGNIHRGVGGEGLSQIATGGTYEFSLPYDVGVGNSGERLPTLSGFHSHVLEGLALRHGVLTHAIGLRPSRDGGNHCQQDSCYISIHFLHALSFALGGTPGVNMYHLPGSLFHSAKVRRNCVNLIRDKTIN